MFWIQKITRDLLASLAIEKLERQVICLTHIYRQLMKGFWLGFGESWSVGKPSLM